MICWLVILPERRRKENYISEGLKERERGRGRGRECILVGSRDCRTS